MKDDLELGYDFIALVERVTEAREIGEEFVGYDPTGEASADRDRRRLDAVRAVGQSLRELIEGLRK